MTKKQNVLELAMKYGIGGINYVLFHLHNDSMQAFADALTKPLEEVNRQLRTIIDEENKDHIEQQAKLQAKIVMEFSHDEVPEFTQGYSDNDVLEVVTAERCNGLVAKIAEQQKELDECKDAVVKLREPMRRAYRGGFDANLWNEFDVVLSATSALNERLCRF